MGNPIIEVDLHNMTVEQAVKASEAAVNKADGGVYRIRLIHGFNGGTRIKNAVIDEFSYGRNSKVKRIEPGSNQGITELILREF